MMKPITYPRIGLDMFLMKLTWSYWFLGITSAIHIFRIIMQDNPDSSYNAGYISSNIFMLVVGILAISFLRYSVENGVTRKNYFYGSVIASILLSIALPILLYLISLIEKFILVTFTNKEFVASPLDNLVVDVDGNAFAEIILAVILTPFVSVESNLLLSLTLLSVNLLMFYLVGWLIAAAFQRLGVVVGILIIAVSIGLIAIKDSMLRIALDMPLYESFKFFDAIPNMLAIPIVILTIIITLVFIRLLTRNLALKI